MRKSRNHKSRRSIRARDRAIDFAINAALVVIGAPVFAAFVFAAASHAVGGR